MPSYVYISPYQQKVILSEAACAYTVIGHSAGSGTTFALMHAASNWCSNNPNKSVTFFTPQRNIHCSGGVVDQARDILLKDSNCKFSSKSSIFTFQNGAKIKFASASQGIEATMGLDREFMIFDTACPDDLIAFHLRRARHAIIADYLLDMLEPDSWANQYNLLREDKSGFIPLVNYIPADGVESNHYMMANNPTYVQFLCVIQGTDKLRLTTTRF